MNPLKKAREMSFLTFEEIAEQINVPIAYLQAMEKEEYKPFLQNNNRLEKYIRLYADFLEVDPIPIINAYQGTKINHTDEVPMRRRSRKVMTQKNGNKFFYNYRFYLLALVSAVLLAIITWMMIHKEEQAAESIPQNKVAFTPTKNQNRPIFTLQKTDKLNLNRETWFISQTSTIHLNLQAKGKVKVSITEGTPSGKILTKKSLKKGEFVDISAGKIVFIQLDNPNNSLLKVNDVIIDTSAQKTSYMYEFKVVAN